ncbi:MAG TPA: hypothetical protein VIY68_06885, partial [Steroidobacteraceae bacterium]
MRAVSLNWRWGIGAHLGVAFAAVVALAVAANLLIEHEISVVRTTRIVRVEASPVVPMAASIGVRPQPAAASVAPQIETLSAKSLVASLEHFADAVRDRSVIHNDDSDRELGNAAQELQRETAAYVAASVPGASVAREKLLPHFADLRAAGDELVRTADARRGVLKEFWDRFDALDARTKASLAGSWKIFGRVIARKTLVDLNSTLDEIRREFSKLPVAGLHDHDALGPVTASETALAASLEINDAALTRSQGAAWVNQSRIDLAQLKVLQDRLVILDAKRRDAEVQLTKSSESLIAQMTAAAPPVSARSHKIDALPLPENQPALTPVQAALTPVEPALNPVLATHGAFGENGERATETTSTSDQKPKGLGLIFWISTAVVAILLWVSIRTVMSVVEPVRRIRSATLKIAGGETGARVKRGG